MARRFGELLLKRQCVSEEHLEQALSEQSDSGGRIGSVLLQLGHVSNDDVGQCLSIQHGVPFASANALAHATVDALEVIPGDLCHRYQVLPFALDDGVLSVAMADPKRSIAGDLSFQLKQKIKRHVSVHEDIQQFLKLYYARQGEQVKLQDIGDVEEPTPVQEELPFPRGTVEITDDGVKTTASARKAARLASQDALARAKGRRVEQILRALDLADSVADVCDLLVEPVEQEVTLAVLLLVEDAHLAQGCRAWGPGGMLPRPDLLLLPLDTPSLLQEALRSQEVVRAETAVDPDLVQTRMASALGLLEPGEVHVAPITVGAEVRYLLCIHAAFDYCLPRRTRDDLQMVADAASASMEWIHTEQLEGAETVHRLRKEVERLRGELDRAERARDVLVAQIMVRPQEKEVSRSRSVLAIGLCVVMLMAVVYLFSKLYLPVPWRDTGGSEVRVEKRSLPVVPIRQVPPRPTNRRAYSGTRAAPAR